MLQSKDRVADWIKEKKKRAYNMPPPRDSTEGKDTHKLKVREWKMIFHVNGKDKQAGLCLSLIHISEPTRR